MKEKRVMVTQYTLKSSVYDAKLNVKLQNLIEDPLI